MDHRAVVIGLYGLPGSGKTTILEQLRHQLGRQDFLFLEGSDLIADEVGGSLEHFHELDEAGKKRCREQAISNAAKQARESCKAAIVAGHFMFWDDEEISPEPVWTDTDESTFTHVLYLRVDGDVVAQRRSIEEQKRRPLLSSQHLCEWQQEETRRLRQICYKSGILFLEVVDPNRLPVLMNDFMLHQENYNTAQAERTLDNAVVSATSALETILVIDGDKTLISQDSGETFFDKMSPGPSPLKVLFQTATYSYTSFRQAMLLYEEAADDARFDSTCTELASVLTIQPEIESILRAIVDRDQIRVVVLTCGLGLTFQKILRRCNLHERIAVVGGGRLSDGFVITPHLKASLVRRLQQKHNLRVWAFGDSPMDLPMLQQADEAIVVVGDESTRSQSMGAALKHAVETDGLQARQILCSGASSLRLDGNVLPVVGSKAIAAQLLARDSVQVFCASEPAALLLSTPMRDANIAGSHLREAHRRVGWYLAIEHIPHLIGLEMHGIQHVQGHMSTGHRISDEAKTCIIPLMRGGEPMAFGVSDALPLAMFLHAKQPDEVTSEHLEDLSTVVLVDSIINTGKSIVDFVHRLKRMRPNLRIIVLAGTVQNGAISGRKSLTMPLKGYTDVSLIALRLSENRFTGTKSTDTGNRLFNTTQLE